MLFGNLESNKLVSTRTLQPLDMSLRFSRMRISSFFIDCAVILPLWAHASTSSGQSISLTPTQCQRLAEIVRSDQDAAAMFAVLKREADQSLSDQPEPIERIQTEGKLPGDPARIKSRDALADMGKLMSLGWVYAVTGESKYAAKARQFILAWTIVNRSKGDPIDDTSLEPLLLSYDLTRGIFSPEERQFVDAHLQGVAAAEMASAKKDANNQYNNWHSHRLKIVGLIALSLHDRPLIEQIARMYRDQIDHNIESDGSTTDFHERDALDYHIYDLEPLLTLAIAAQGNGIDLYSYQSPHGGSLSKGIQFLIPFAQGIKTHAEFVHSKVKFDRKRAEAGDIEHQAGRPFNPPSAIPILALAEYFDPSLLGLIQNLASKPGQKYVTWQMVLNDSRK
jgi:hypothetical protein